MSPREGCFWAGAEASYKQTPPPTPPTTTPKIIDVRTRTENKMQWLYVLKGNQQILQNYHTIWLDLDMAFDNITMGYFFHVDLL